MDDKEKIKQYVNRLAGSGISFEDYWIHQRSAVIDSIEKKTIWYHFPVHRDDVILDAGCGEGRFTLDLATRCRHVYALDFSEMSLDILMRRASERGLDNITPICADIVNGLPFTKVDGVLSIQVFSHLPGADERIRVLREWRRVLREGGNALVSVFNYSRVLNRVRHMPRDLRKTEGYAYIHWFSVHELATAAKEAGFESVQSTGCINLPSDLRPAGCSAVDIFLSRSRLSVYLGQYLLARLTVRSSDKL